IPATAIAILAAAGSARPTAIVGTAFFATLCAATVAVLSAKFFERLSFFRPVTSEGSKKKKEPAPRPAYSKSQYADKFAFDDESLGQPIHQDRKSTRLNSSHVSISYAVFCLKKKKKKKKHTINVKKNIHKKIIDTLNHNTSTNNNITSP